MLHLHLAADPGTTTTVCLCPGHTHGIGITGCISESQIAVSCTTTSSTLFRHTHTIMYTMTMFSLSVPTQVVDLQYAQTELAAVLLLACPSSCSSISLLGENYRFFSKMTGSCLPYISWLVIWDASLMGKVFPIHHSSVLHLAAGTMGSIDSSTPILWFWMLLLVKTRECN